MSNENTDDVVDADSSEITPDNTAIVASELKPVEKLSEQEMLAVEAAIMTNNFGGLTVSQRMAIVVKRCDKLGVDPTQGPFVWGKGQGGKLMLIATKNLSQQLRANKNLKCNVLERTWDHEHSLYIVRVEVEAPDGRKDEDIGVVTTLNKRGEGLANALMGAFTKAKNRATLSLCGVGGLDESEMASIRAEQSQRLFQSEPQGPRRIEPGPSAMNQGVSQFSNETPLHLPLQVSKTGMPFARDLVKAGKGGLLEEEQETLSGDEAGAEKLKPTPLPLVAPPTGRVITARPPSGLVKAGGPAPQLGNPPQHVSTANPPAPRPPKASPVRAGGR